MPVGAVVRHVVEDHPQARARAPPRSAGRSRPACRTAGLCPCSPTRRSRNRPWARDRSARSTPRPRRAPRGGRGATGCPAGRRRRRHSSPGRSAGRLGRRRRSATKNASSTWRTPTLARAATGRGAASSLGIPSTSSAWRGRRSLSATPAFANAPTSSARCWPAKRCRTTAASRWSRPSSTAAPWSRRRCSALRLYQVGRNQRAFIGAFGQRVLPALRQ